MGYLTQNSMDSKGACKVSLEPIGGADGMYERAIVRMLTRCNQSSNTPAFGRATRRTGILGTSSGTVLTAAAFASLASFTHDGRGGRGECRRGGPAVDLRRRDAAMRQHARRRLVRGSRDRQPRRQGGVRLYRRAVAEAACRRGRNRRRILSGFRRRQPQYPGAAAGSDPRLKDQYVIVSAHYDHVGYGKPNNSFGPIGYIHKGPTTTPAAWPACSP